MQPDKAVIKRNPDGTIAEGSGSLNPAGRPKGKTLKEYWRERFSNMTDEEKLEFSKKVDPRLLWTMAEGNPHQTTDAQVVVTLPKPILGGTTDVSSNDSTKQD